MTKKILAILPESKTSKKSKLTPASKSASTSEKKSIYQDIETLVLKNSEEKEIVDSVKDYYKELGKTLLYVKKTVKQLISIIKADYNIK